MGSEPCDELQAELALDLVEAELAVELPAHLRAFARAHADGRPPPPAPLLARSASTLTAARNACAHDLLVDRGLALLRLVAPLAIESDPAVIAARAEPPTWAGLQRLTEARDRVAQATFGCTSIALVHRLSGVATPPPPTRHADIPGPTIGPAIDGWRTAGAPLAPAAILEAWNLIAARFGVTGSVRIERTTTSRPRAFVIEPKQEVIVVIPAAVDTPVARFAVLHELGHAVVALGLRAGVPRVVDEAAASYVARLAEPPSWLPATWPSELAASARARRLAIATALDAVERGLPALHAIALPSQPDGDARMLAALVTQYGPTPPWALWHDPGAQASYVAAEALSDRLRLELGTNPARGHLLRTLIAERDRIDQHTRL